MQNIGYLPIGSIPDDGESHEEDTEEPGWLKIIDDPELRKEFRYVYKEFRLGNLDKHETVVVENLLATALQLYQYQKKYNEKNVDIDLEDSIKMILSDALSIVVVSRSRYGFERKMQATTINRVEQDEAESRKTRLRLLGLFGGGESE